MEMCTGQGHVAGMLDRDQRTAKMCNFDRRAVFVREYEDLPDQAVITRTTKTISHRFVLGRTSPQSSCKTRKNRHFWKSLHRLKHALIVGTYLSLVTFPSILSAPTTIMSSGKDAEPIWFNPCGHRGGDVNGAPSEHRFSDYELVHTIVLQAKIAENNAKRSKEEYIRQTFKMDVPKVYELYENHDYDWLPTKNDIPKKLGQPLNPEHLTSLELSETLSNVHIYLQKLAAAVEQIASESKNCTENKNCTVEPFEDIENNLRSVLCEVHTAIIDKELPDKKVFREELPEYLQKYDNSTNRNQRNWVVYRDYLITLEYVIEVFEHFEQKLSPKS